MAFPFVHQRNILILLTLMSKNVIIFNEEILVLLSFLAFFFTCQASLQDAVKEAFQARRDAIQLELQGYLTLREELFKSFWHGYSSQLTLVGTTTALGSYSCLELLQVGLGREQGLLAVCKQQTQQKLKTLSTASQTFQLEVQKTLASGFRNLVYEELRGLGSGGKKVVAKQNLIGQGLTVLKKNVKKKRGKKA